MVPGLQFDRVAGVGGEERTPCSDAWPRVSPLRSGAPGADALAPFEDESRFVGECLRRAYDALGRCEPFKSDLSSAASACMVPAVNRALAAAPSAIAAAQAKLARVRHALLLASEESVRLAQDQR